MAGVHGMMMMGKTPEVVFVNTVNRTQANIYELMGSPTVPNIYVFENTATISAATQSGWALQTGAFPAGSTLTIINRGDIRGGGGNGGGNFGNGGAGGTALILNFPVSIDNTTGTIWGGGGGGGASSVISGKIYGGGGGAGIPGGIGGIGGKGNGSNGSATDGGTPRGGAPGSAGGSDNNLQSNPGRGGYSVQRDGNAVSWIAVGDRRGLVE